ncbi:MAG: HlyD family secretion protein, partial [Gammaproteobacteria bacterium]|nr:HlyD family secretion protein [Gammaproteobacteria bacterium]
MSATNSFRKFSLRSLGLPLLIIGITAVIIWTLVATRPQLEAVEAPEQIWNVDVIKAQHAEVTPLLGLFGEVVAGRRSELRPSVNGVIVEIGENFHDGGIVKKGELLVQIDPF